ncbi:MULTISPECIES: class I SAM-dependent DNA methyltransferase [unclassified Mycoplasma]|uniref:HsdM family class I SAM-dependent methyltransferase n=1 Tax=unclassified Mycoplasma TaxID=2683645 RepID=UPI00211CB126|nr:MULTISPECIES: SAM-dependent methyltransferase [unclassified Mycoplasma]UUM19746.1 SAM-dependent methyltransferase [Mycoplasma sp. 1578d]UUM24730.1 SAM-dependent methyltransferase [Mycoplasma sp. 3686d]
MSKRMRDALCGSSKTENKTGVGEPDLHIEKYKIPVIFENKLYSKKLIDKNKEGISEDASSIRNFAVNGALYYAKEMIESNLYKEVIAIGVAGNSDEDAQIQVYYVHGPSMKIAKLMSQYTNLGFLENDKTFDNFYEDAILSEKEKHQLIISSKKILKEYSTKLNKLMHNLSITASQRVLYVSGMLLSMQDVIRDDGSSLLEGLVPDKLKGHSPETDQRDGKMIVGHIKEFLNQRNIDSDKKELMLASFSEISKDKQRDLLIDSDELVSNFLPFKSSKNKQIFTFIYEYIFKQINNISRNIDIVGEMYSEFLKYAYGDGKEIGIVLTPPYITQLMAEIINVSEENKVMDLAAGSGGFLISSMNMMIDSAERKYGKGTTKAKNKILEIKKKRLLGVELNAEMYTLAATNMILRGDGSSNIQKGDTFNTPEELYINFKADRLLLNPPFSFEENGMPFLKFGLERMQKGGLAAIIIQDSAGTGKARVSNKIILKNNTLLASIKMPVDLFQPMAGVATSIYIFQAGIPHDFNKTVKFVDFRKDGYKRTDRGIREIDRPEERYRALIDIYKNGLLAKVDPELFNIKEIYVEDFITQSGEDWNFDQHKKVELKPNLSDFKKTIADFLSWEVQKIFQSNALRDENLKK